MFAIDLSNFSGTFDIESAKLFRDSNRRVIIGTQDPTIAIGQLSNCRAACLDVQLYQMHYFSVPLERELDKTLEVIRATGLDHPKVWLDFEDSIDFGLISPDVVLGWIHRAVSTATAVGLSVGIYTRRGWWGEATGNSHEFLHYELWDANYDGVPDLSAFTPYGGWEKPAMKQYQENYDLWGTTVNLNVY